MQRRVLFPTLVLLLLVAGPLLAQVGTNQGLLNPNLASEEDLTALPQLGAGGAATVIAGRPWLSMAALHEAVGADLSEEQQRELYARLWLPINLNDVTEAEILLIPGVGTRMAREFEEYRPYAGLAVFRREMGKYVDDGEVARLEQFVFVPLDLNSASSEDFATIPGVGPRMIHEFEEYRPYAGIEQFRRESGKYVDEDEVARFERYMVIGTSPE
jgi:DNA uptake protein ComE-like DNA-binding protein